MKSLALTLIVVILTFSACQNEKEVVVDKSKIDPQSIEVVAEEVLNVASYTYVLVDDYGDKIWIAIPKQEIEIGKKYYYKDFMEMKNFKSEDLDRTFESVLFVQEIRTEPFMLENAPEANTPPGSKKAIGDKITVSVEPAEGGITIADLYENKADLNGKMVKLSGKVTKFNAAIMSKNWVHIQDGTDFDGNFDLTLTTDDVFEIGTIVEVEGAVAIDKDFGFGYKYEVLLENGKKLSVQSN
ncbi:MAG: hypothetical protein KKA84_07725 [Bacteroidetes bacterium]|nr:hypothetical protein [Bacteroidota bacterium]